MKKILKVTILLFSISVLFSQCKPDKLSIKDKTPDAKFTCEYLADGVKIESNATITVNDKVVFTSVNDYNVCGTDFVLFTGQLGKKFEPYFFMGSTETGVDESIQKNKSYGTLLDTLNNKFVSSAIKFDAAGKYTVYCVASFVNKKTGEVKMDSTSMVINVIDPSYNQPVLTSFTIQQIKGKGTLIDATIGNDSIKFVNIVSSNASRFINANIKFNPTSVIVKSGPTVLTDVTPVTLTEGSKITVYAADGVTSKDYTVSIKYFVSSSPLITSASYKNVIGDSTFTGTSTIVGDSIKIGILPYGITTCSLTVKVTNVADKIYTINSWPYKITTTSQDGKATKDYWVTKNGATIFNASYTVVSLTNTTSYLMKQITGGYSFSVTNASDMKIAKLKITTNQFAKMQYDTLSDYSTVRSFISESTVIDFTKYSTVYFKVVNGTDVKTFFIKMSELQ